MAIDKKALLKYILSALVAGILLYFSFRGVKWADFLEAVRGCRPGWLLAAMSAGVLAFLVRALRWGQIVRPTDDSVKLRDTFNAVNISYLVNLALPRAGELARCGFLARHCRRAGYDKLLGTVVLERLWDVLMMFILVLVLAWAMWDRFGSFFVEKMLNPFSARLNFGLGGIVLILAILCGLMLWGLFALRNRWKPAGLGLCQGSRAGDCELLPDGALVAFPALFICNLGIVLDDGRLCAVFPPGCRGFLAGWRDGRCHSRIVLAGADGCPLPDAGRQFEFAGSRSGGLRGIPLSCGPCPLHRLRHPFRSRDHFRDSFARVTDIDNDCLRHRFLH